MSFQQDAAGAAKARRHTSVGGLVIDFVVTAAIVGLTWWLSNSWLLAGIVGAQYVIVALFVWRITGGTPGSLLIHRPPSAAARVAHEATAAPDALGQAVQDRAFASAAAPQAAAQWVPTQAPQSAPLPPQPSPQPSPQMPLVAQNSQPAPMAAPIPMPAPAPAPAPALPTTLVLPNGEVVPLNGGSLIVGRNPRADDGEIAVRLDDPMKSISRSHFRITATDSSVQVVDLGSANGTRLRRAGQDLALTAQQAVPLAPGDSIVLGRFELRLN